MVLIQHKSRRKSTGGRFTSYRKKRKYEIGRKAADTKVGDKKLYTVRTKGGDTKTKIAIAASVNVIDPKTKKASTTTIKNVAENPANWHFVRRNIITKGSVIETDLGKAKVTSRPGQDGAINAVLVK